MSVMNSEIPQALYEKAVGHQALEYVKTLGGEELLAHVESDALELLSQIKAILDDDAVEDPECFRRIDALVNAFGAKGIYTPRHDW